MALAQAAGSWVVEITTSGGFSGRGRGSLTVASDGTTRCAGPATCASRLAGDAINMMTGRLAALRTAGWEVTPADDTCRDCYQTTMTVRRRPRDGGEAISVFKWTDITFTKAPDDVKRVYETMVQVAQTRDGKGGRWPGLARQPR